MTLFLLLKRKPAQDGAVLGALLVNGVWECFTLERVDAQIPAGHYPVTITPSARFHRLLPLIDVPGRSGIRIHPGNFIGDTEGCILVGHGSALDSVVDSRLAMQALQPKIAGALAHHDEVWLTIVDPPRDEAQKA